MAESANRLLHGSCHCGRVRFEVSANPTSLSQCNCSLCSKKGALYVKVREIAELRVTSGEPELCVYQFNTRRAKHYFCRHCGIHVFHRPRLDPERWSVNARCLDELDIARFALTEFDGRNWEAQARAEGWTLPDAAADALGATPAWPARREV
jgi:hypothetical protein